MQNNNLKTHFLQKFPRYLLIGLSAFILLAGAQQGLFNNQSANFALADDHGEVDECTDPDTPQTDTCHDSVGTGHKYCTWTESGNKWSECKIESCNIGTKAPPVCVADMVSPGNASSQWQCERDIAAGQQTCTDNITFCEDTGPNQSTIFLKRSGACNPTLREADSRGCVFYHEPLEFRSFACGAAPTCEADAVVRTQPDPQGCTRNIHTRADCSEYLGGPFNCPAPVAGAPAAPAQEERVVERVVERRVAEQPVEEVVQVRQRCPEGTTFQEVKDNTIICVQNINTNTNTNTNVAAGGNSGAVASGGSSSSVAIASGGQGGSVGNITVQAPTPQTVTQTVTRVVEVPVVTRAVAVREVKELPKTGLPALLWSALAFIPAGFRMRRLGAIKGDLENHPSYIWENRQFRSTES